MTVSLNSYPWTSLSAVRRVGDLAWQYDVNFHGHSYPPYFKDLIYIPAGQSTPIMFCHPVTATRESGPFPQKSSAMSGYSMGWYLRDDIEPSLRSSVITTNSAGAVTDYENPTNYLCRLFWKDGNGAYPLRGFYPGVVAQVPNWGLVAGNSGFDWNHPAITKKQFGFDSESISDAIDTLSEHGHMILLDDFRLVNGVWRNVVHWVPEYYIDNLNLISSFGIPAPLTITKGGNDDDLVGDPSRSSDLNSEESKNCVRVELLRSKSDSEKWFYATWDSPAVTAYQEPRRVLKYQSPDICIESDTDAQCQAKANAKRDELANFVQQSDNTYEATFRHRYDFRHYQTIRFTGFDDVPNVDLRIVGIRYDCNSIEEGGDRVTLTMTEKLQWVLSRKYKRLMDEMQNQVAAIEKTVYAQIRMISSGTITYVDPNGTYAVARSDVSRELIQGRSWNQ